MCDGHAYILNVFYWNGDGKTMFSFAHAGSDETQDSTMYPVEKVYRPTCGCEVTLLQWCCITAAHAQKLRFLRIWILHIRSANI